MDGQGVGGHGVAAQERHSILRGIQRAIESCSLATIIALALLVKAVLLFIVIPQFATVLTPFYGVSFADDYDKLAWNIVLGHGYRFFPDTATTLMREPGYPLFLALVFKVFGYGLTVARVANVILAGATAFVLAGVTRRVTLNRSAPAIAALLFLFHPGTLIAESRGGVEILFIFLLVTFIWVLRLALDKQRPLLYAVGGAVLGLTVLVRSTVILFPVFVLAYLLFRDGRAGAASAVRNVAIMAVAMALVVSPWVVRNYYVAQVYTPTASVKGVAAQTGQYICSNMSFQGGFQKLDIAASEERARLAAAAGYRFKDDYYQYFYTTQDELAFNTLLWDRTVAQYAAAPLLFLKCASSNLFNFWFAGKNWSATGLNVLAQLPYLMLAGLGAYVFARRGGLRRIAPLLLLIAYFLAVYVPIHAQARYSTPLVPFISVLAAVALATWLHRPDRARAAEPTT